MSFAVPMALAFFGLFVPTILLYLLKQRRRRVEVSTLMFWEKILRDEQTVTSISRLKKILSLFLQLLFITLLTLSVARPLLSGKRTGARRLILLIDTSASMLVNENGRTRFELARQKALGVVRGMAIGDTLLLVSAGAWPEILHPFTDSKRELQEAIGRLQPGHGEINFRKVVEWIEQLPADERETDVYLISDGAFEPVEIVPPPRTKFAYLPVGTETDNIGITAFHVRPLPFSPRDFQIQVEIANHTEKDRKVPLELRINGRLSDVHEFSIPAGKSVSRTLQQFSAEGGEVEAAIDVKDAFPLDDHAYAALPRPQPIRVRLVTAGNPFLESALATDEGVDLEIVPPDHYAGGGTNVVTVFAGWHPATTPPGSSIFVGDWPDDLGLARSGSVTNPIFTDWLRDHPINRHLALQNVKIEKAAKVQSYSRFQRLASSFEDPLVLLRESEQQKILAITFDTTTTDLPLRVAFPILIANAIRYLGGIDAGENWINPLVGTILGPAELERYAPRGKAEELRPLRSVIGPDGTRFPAQGANALVPVGKTGFYRGESAPGETFPLFAATLSSRIESQIKPSKTIPLRSKQPLVEIQEGFRLGFEPWLVLALAGLLLSTVEWALFHRRVIE